MSGYRPPYTIEEQKKIVRYIIDKKIFYSLRGNECWKQMIEDGVVNRTWQSVKEHFRKQILNMLRNPKLGLTAEEAHSITYAYNSTAITKQSTATAQSSNSETMDITDILYDSSDDEL